jgi:hypothetical protein
MKEGVVVATCRCGRNKKCVKSFIAVPEEKGPLERDLAADGRSVLKRV